MYDPRVKFARHLVLVVAFAAGTASAQQYRWVDEKGRVNYSDTPPPASAKSVQKMNLQGYAVGAQPSYELSQAMKSSPVTLYSHPDCKELCQMARDVLNKCGVPFAEISAVDAAKLEELKKVSGGVSVPVLVVGAQVETSISTEAYNRVLDYAGYPRAGVARPRSQAAPASAPAAEKP